MTGTSSNCSMWTMTIFIKRCLVLIVLVLVQFVFISPQKAYAATATVNLGTADSFAVLAGSQVIDSNISVIGGNVGLSPAGWGESPALTCGEVIGTIYSVDDSGPLSCRVTDAGLLTIAKNDLTTAYNDAAGRTPAIDLGTADDALGTTLTPGIYAFGHATTANLIGTLTLDTQGDPNAVFIFQASSDLITASGSVVQFLNGETCNVFWQVTSSATIGTRSTFVGTIMALASISDNGYSTITGRLLASTAAVTLNHTTINVPTCAPTATPLSCGGDEHLDAGGVNCVTFGVTGPAPESGGVTSTGQVLGASTLGSTGTANSKLGIMLMLLGTGITLISFYALKKNSL